ncbi:MAG: ComF family protein [Clostridia bacterium]|nr:ComF family protein [Clostridia bacterium]
MICRRPSDGELLCCACRDALADSRLKEEVRQDLFIDEWISVWSYRDGAKQLVHLLKFDAVADAAIPLAEGMAEAARRMALPRRVLVTSVPMPVRRRSARGIDHGMTLAMGVAIALGAPYRPLMRRSGSAGTQRGLSREKRLTNLQGAFRCERLCGEDILLVDDVLTTGATAQLCAQALREAGAGSVRVVTATRAEKRRKPMKGLIRR